MLNLPDWVIELLKYRSYNLEFLDYAIAYQSTKSIKKASTDDPFITISGKAFS